MQKLREKSDATFQKEVFEKMGFQVFLSLQINSDEK